MFINKILKILGKNVLAFAGGAVLGIASVILRFFPNAIEKVASSKEPLGAVVLAPVLLVVYGIFGVVIGGILGVLVYNIFKIILKIKRAKT